MADRFNPSRFTLRKGMQGTPNPRVNAASSSTTHAQFIEKQAREAGRRADIANRATKTAQAASDAQKAMADAVRSEGIKGNVSANREANSAARRGLTGLDKNIRKTINAGRVQSVKKIAGNVVDRGVSAIKAAGRFALKKALPGVGVATALLDPNTIANSTLGPDFKRLNAEAGNAPAPQPPTAEQIRTGQTQPQGFTRADSVQPQPQAPAIPPVAATPEQQGGPSPLLAPGTPENPTQAPGATPGSVQTAATLPNGTLTSTITQPDGGTGTISVPGGVRDNQGNPVSPQNFLSRGSLSQTSGTIGVRQPDGSIVQVPQSVGAAMRRKDLSSFLQSQNQEQASADLVTRRNRFLNLLSNARTQGDVNKAKAGLAALDAISTGLTKANAGDSGKAALNAAKVAKLTTETQKIAADFRKANSPEGKVAFNKRITALVGKHLNDGGAESIVQTLFPDADAETRSFALTAILAGRVPTKEALTAELARRKKGA